MKVKSLSRVRLFATPWTEAHQAPLSMGFFQAKVLEWGAIVLLMAISSTSQDLELLKVFFLNFHWEYSFKGNF